MIEDITTPMSPGWWFARLADQLIKRREGFARLQSYIDGSCEIPRHVVAKSTAGAYQRLKEMARLNFAELIVEAPRERMRPVGFRSGSNGSKELDDRAWQLWQANRLDAWSMLVHRTELTLGYSYVIVGPNPGGRPRITPEDPREVIVQADPLDPLKALAGLKMIRDTLIDRDVAYVYVPGRILRAQRDPQFGTDGKGVQTFNANEWTFDEGETAVPGNEVPVVPFVNRPTLWNQGVGEFELHTATLDRINYQILQRLEVATLQAFKQRAIKGVPDEDEDGNPVNYDDVFVADPGAMWLLPETAELWESGMVDLNPIRQAIRDDVQDLAAATRTPLYYLAPDANQGSAEGAALAREGLVFKTEDRITTTTESWERVLQLALLMDGFEAPPDGEVLWAPVERYSLAERYDAAAKAIAAGVPWRQVMLNVLQFSPAEVDRMEAERMSDAMFGGGVSQADSGAAAQEMAAKVTSLGVLVRTGVDPASAASTVGLTGLSFTGAVPVSLRLPAEDAAPLEGGPA